MRIAFFANDDFYLVKSRLSLIQRLKNDGHDIFAVAAGTNAVYRTEIEKAGAVFLPIKLKRGIDFWGSLNYFFSVFFISRKYHFDICHNFNPKPAIFASLAQNFAGIKRIAFSVSGLGFVYSSDLPVASFFRFFADIGYKLAAKLAKAVVFQNKSDQQYFIDRKYVSSEKAFLIRGSGIDENFFSLEKMGARKDRGSSFDRSVVMISRIFRSKGVADFAAAAAIFKKKNPGTVFSLVGPLDEENPDSIGEKEIREWEENGWLIWFGEIKEKEKLRNILFEADVFVFPSFYAEGLPKTVLEAMAMELPVIVAENKGLEGVVENKENGIVVPARSPEKIAEAVELILADKVFAEKLGRRAREKVVQEFSGTKIAEETVNLYRRLAAEG